MFYKYSLYLYCSTIFVSRFDCRLYLQVADGGAFGEWTDAEFCPEGHFAVGYQMRVSYIQISHLILFHLIILINI